MAYPTGLDPFISRQNLLHHTYSPVISVSATHQADELIQRTVHTNVTLLEVLKPFGNNAKYTVPGQSFKIINNQLITRNYASFPVRFQPSMPEMLSVAAASNEQKSVRQLFSISSLEAVAKHHVESSSGADLYSSYFNKIITSSDIVAFDTFNHPVAQLFAVDCAKDSVETLREAIVKFRNFTFPKYFQIEDLLVHVLVLYDPSECTAEEAVQMQSDIKKQLSLSSLLVPVKGADSGTSTRVSMAENSTIEEDLQRIRHAQWKEKEECFLDISSALDTALRTRLHEFISKYLIPHMQAKVRAYDDQVLQPKKSIAGRFFSVSKKLFNNNDIPGPATVGYNHQEHYYHKSSAEQTIRRLADWALMLKDFKYAYATYDLIKKDYANDKAWAYVASTQEMCIVSLLLAQTQQNGVAPADKNTLRKIRHDIIEPYMDNLLYTFKSRLNLKTYALKSLAVVVELLLCICDLQNLAWKWNDLVEKYLLRQILELESHASQDSPRATVALLYERLGYSFGTCVFLDSNNKDMLVISEPVVPHVEDGFYENPHKMRAPGDTAIVGLTRFRKSAAWYLLAAKAWMELKHAKQAAFCLGNMERVYRVDLGGEWYDRGDLLLGKIKRWINEASEVSVSEAN